MPSAPYSPPRAFPPGPAGPRSLLVPLVRARRLGLGFLGRAPALHAAHDIVDAEEHARHLDRRLDRLLLHHQRLPDAELTHVREDALLPVDAPGAGAGCARSGRRGRRGVLGAQFRDDAHNVAAAVLCEGARDHLESLRRRLVGPLERPLHALGLLREADAEGHLARAAPRHEHGCLVNVARDAHGVQEVALHLVEHVLGRAAQEDGARLRVLAVHEEGEVLLPDLGHLEEAAARAHVRLFNLLWAVHDGGSAGAGDAVVVRLAHAAEHGDARLDEEVLREVGHALLRHDDVGLDGDDVAADACDPVLLLLEERLPLRLVRELHGGGGLVLLVLEGAVQQQHAGVADLAAHLGVCHVLVYHDALEHARVLNVAAGQLLHLGVALDVDLLAAVGVHVHAGHRVQRQVHHEVGEARDELGADGGPHEGRELAAVGEVDGECHRLEDGEGVVEALEVARADDGGVEVAEEQGLRHVEHLPGDDDD
mmetsp:Transcript_17104/g.49578  ORF Transcript_17104/g.49578 Transcript_17104/m.49578 type:complete len:482 (+) Transcript_17104:407-1852(+)